MRTDVLAFYGLKRGPRSAAGYYETQHHQQLLRDIHHAVREARLVVLSGVIGVGKSLMLDKLKERLVAEGEVLVSRAVTLERQKITLGTLITALFCDLSSGRRRPEIPKQSELRERKWLNGFYADADWDDAYIDALDATGQTEEAQSTRWARFERHLSISRLRGYLKLLKDFDDVIAEEKAMEHALAFPNATTALAFFVEWPNPASAAKLVIARDAEINGGAYYLLDPAARLLEGSHPLAATLLRRAMIHDTLDGARSKRYRHAARHLAECAALNGSIPDYGDFESHDAFLASIQATHRRKSGFWACVQEFEGKKV